MSDLRELYQEVILDHGKNPRNFGTIPTANRQKEGLNPLCGDRITLSLFEEHGLIKDLRFEGCGCAISMASGSLMTESLKGKTLQYAEEVFQLFHQCITGGVMTEIQKEKLGKLTVLSGVSAFPLRVKCATLAWHILKALLQNDLRPVTTE